MPLSKDYFEVVRVASRPSLLARKQVEEVFQELLPYRPRVRFISQFTPTIGDLDQITSLRNMEKTDFFTREIDRLVLDDSCDVGIHAAKDLPDPLPKGLVIVAITKGVDPRDCIVLKDDGRDKSGKLFWKLKPGSKIATSSARREEMIREMRPDLELIDIRGNIEVRLEKLKQGYCDGLVMAEAALIRLGLNPNRLILDVPAAPLQGKLAILAKEGDTRMKTLFQPINYADAQNSLFWFNPELMVESSSVG